MSIGLVEAPYVVFGRLLQDLRVRAGIGKQAELANRLGLTQQTISRWERGLSRPRDKEMPKIASVLAADQDVLFEAAGYAPSPAAATFDRPFPVNALSPESFERFCAHFLERLYRDVQGNVHRAGGTGHLQDGIDISVTGSFGRHTFQCKRVDEFGPQKVRTAITKHIVQASHKFLLLSNIASPQARAVLSDHPDWEIWDREDISRRVRSLPVADQLDLVDVFFRGRRLELVGEAEAGPWMTPEQFFGPYLEPGRLFNHKWKLVGRIDEAAALEEILRDDSIIVSMLVGAPGGGKTRLLRHVVDRLDVENRGLRVWFVSPTEVVTAKHLDQLGRGKKILIVDDAHDREDLDTLIRFCAEPENHARLLLSLRPYGRDSVKHQAASLSLSGPHVREIEMHRPTRADAEALAAEVLAECGGPVHAAGEIAKATFDSPLVTVVGSQIVARENIHPVLLGNIDDFQTLILARLQDVIAGEIASGQDAGRVQGVLRIVSLVQPVLPDEPALISLLGELEQINQPDATRLLRTLTEAGVLFRRGLRYRLSPDLLADSVIRRYCINQDGTSNGYIERVFELAQPPYIKNLLVNMGRLDWRLQSGNTTDSRLLDGLWRKLHWQETYSNAHVEAAAAVAYYQPRMALDFARGLVRDGHGDDANVCEILKNAAYNFEFLEEACELLWRAGHDDQRPLHQHPRHAIRILKELAEFEPNKPAEYITRVVNFVIGLIDLPGSLSGAHSPFAILEGALAAEGHSTTASSRRAITMSAYATDLGVVAGVREHVISTLLDCIEHGPPRKAFLAARTMAAAIRGPLGILGLRVPTEVSQSWQEEHARTIDCLGQLLARHPVHPVVLVRAAESVAWHAFNGADGNAAETVLSLLDRDVDTRFVRALMDGWGTNTWRCEPGTSERRAFESDLAKLIQDLPASFSEPSKLHAFVEKWLTELSAVAGEDHGAPHVVVSQLIGTAPGLAQEILQHHRNGSTGPLDAYTGMALSVVLNSDAITYRAAVHELAESSSAGLRLVADAYSRFEAPAGYSEEDRLVLRTIFSSNDSIVLRYAGHLSLQVAKRDKPLAVELICCVDLLAAGQASHDLFMWLSHRETIPEEMIRDDQWRRLLANLDSLNELSDYWVRTFLKIALRVVPDLVIDLLKRRLRRAAETGDWSYSPLDKSYAREDEGLGLVEIADKARHLKSLLDWALESADDGPTLHRFGNVVAALCGKYDQGVLDVVLAWTCAGTDRHIQVAAAVFREAQNDLIFTYPQFVRDVLNSAQTVGPEAVKKISSSLYVASSSGVRGTTPGEPFPEDLRMEKHALTVLGTLSRLDPAFELFTELLHAARSGIAMQQREKAAMDAEEEG